MALTELLFTPQLTSSSLRAHAVGCLAMRTTSYTLLFTLASVVVALVPLIGSHPLFQTTQPGQGPWQNTLPARFLHSLMSRSATTSTARRSHDEGDELSRRLKSEESGDQRMKELHSNKSSNLSPQSSSTTARFSSYSPSVEESFTVRQTRQVSLVSWTSAFSCLSPDFDCIVTAVVSSSSSSLGSAIEVSADVKMKIPSS